MKQARGIKRRQLMGMLAATLAGCGRNKTSGETGALSAQTAALAQPIDGWLDLAFPGQGDEPAQLAALRAERGAPLLVALHGRGEAGRGLAAGAHGWRDDYQLDRAYQRLTKPPLNSSDFQGFVRPGRLAQLNAALKERAFVGVCITCPYTPIVRSRTLEGAQPFARFVTERLVPRAREQAGALGGREHTGIDGVSMGGRLALLVGLSHGAVFGAVGALQPAISENEADTLAELAARASGEHGSQLRLVTSEGDPFRPAVEALGEALMARRTPYQLIITPGPHDYAYNRGPGAYEMLLWHERVLRGGSLAG